MNIIVQRAGQDYGPYSPDAARQHLASGKLLPHDLARPAATPGASWEPLHKLLAGAGGTGARPVGVGGALRQTGRDLRSFDLELVLPWREVFSRRPFRDRRLLYLAAVGLLPAVALRLAPGVGAGYWAIALYFSALWTVFFYYLFRTPQVENRVCALCFFFTAMVAVPVLLFAQMLPPWSWLYAMSGSGQFLARAVGMLFGVGLNEELCKAAVLFWLSRRPGKLLQPQTVVFYGMISGLGFGIYEGVHYQQGLNRQQGVDVAYLLNVARLTSLPFLHAVWTGLAGYFVAFAALNPPRRRGLWVLAIAVPGILHALYDLFGWSLFGLGSALVSVVLLMVYLASATRLQQRLTTL